MDEIKNISQFSLTKMCHRNYFRYADIYLVMLHLNKEQNIITH